MKIYEKGKDRRGAWGHIYRKNAGGTHGDRPDRGDAGKGGSKHPGWGFGRHYHCRLVLPTNKFSSRNRTGGKGEQLPECVL